MLYPVIFFSSMGAVSGPAMQGLISKNVKANEQGTVLGSIASINSLASVLGPLFGLQLFSYFIDPKRFTTPLPGVPFFLGSFLFFLALMVSIVAMKRQHLVTDNVEPENSKLDDGPPPHESVQLH